MSVDFKSYSIKSIHNYITNTMCTDFISFAKINYVSLFPILIYNRVTRGLVHLPVYNTYIYNTSRILFTNN